MRNCKRDNLRNRNSITRASYTYFISHAILWKWTIWWEDHLMCKYRTWCKKMHGDIPFSNHFLLHHDYSIFPKYFKILRSFYRDDSQTIKSYFISFNSQRLRRSRSRACTKYANTYTAASHQCCKQINGMVRVQRVLTVSENVFTVC